MVTPDESALQRPPPRWPQAARPPTAQDADVARSGLTRLLVVDDDLGSIEYLGQLLKGCAQISFATNGEDALRLAAQHRPDLVLLDVVLPGFDGYETCRRLRALPGLQALPIILISQHADTVTEAGALQQGADDFLRKPFDDAQVLARVRTRLRAATKRADGRDNGQALLRRQEEATAVRHATAAMLSYVAHELGNPINVIKGFAQLMQADRQAPLPPAQAERLSHILDAVGQLGSLLADVTDVARMQSGQFLVQPGEVELGALVQQACGPALAQAAEAGLRLRLPAPAAPVRVQADARRLRQCLDNLLSNALKYGRDGGRIEVEITPRGDEIALAVQDHGAGLDAAQLAHLFEPYNRLGQADGAIPGTGLGLALTRDLVQAMGGRLLAHSDGPGRGCRFELMLQPAPG